MFEERLVMFVTFLDIKPKLSYVFYTAPLFFKD